MQKLRRINSEVFVAEETFPSIGSDHADFLFKNLGSSAKGRVRTCIHRSNDDRMHEMFIAFTGSNYVRPSLHIGKDESLHVLKGDADYFFFDGQGRITDCIALGPYGSQHQFYCRIPASSEHALLIRSDFIAIHETTPGPFRRDDTVFSPWSPEESDTDRVADFLNQLRLTPRRERPLLKMDRTGEEVFVAGETIVSIGRKEIDFLKQTVDTTARKRVRLCAHRDTENTLHEMFVVYMDMTYVMPNKHLHKDESLHILEGEADFIFFDDQGKILDIIPLGAEGTGRQFYVRVPAFVYHTLIMRSKHLVIHEATPGPFRREDTVWAPWAPDGTNKNRVDEFMNYLRTAVGCADRKASN